MQRLQRELQELLSMLNPSTPLTQQHPVSSPSSNCPVERRSTAVDSHFPDPQVSAEATSPASQNGSLNGRSPAAPSVLEGISAFPEEDSLFRWIATVSGPSDTLYHGVDFDLRLSFPPSYPFDPPTVTFATPCFHPNVDLRTGSICLDILREKWSAALSVTAVLISIQSLLATPNVDSPLNREAAQLWPYPKGASCSSMIMRKRSRGSRAGTGQQTAMTSGNNGGSSTAADVDEEPIDTEECARERDRIENYRRHVVEAASRYVRRSPTAA